MMSDEQIRNLSRRKFLQRVGIATGVVAGGSAAVIPLAKSPYDLLYPVVDENRVELPPNGHSVVIMGGGLAGLQTGVELSARGFKVTILERSGIPGGKLKSWRDKSFGPSDAPEKQDPNFKGFVREHGAHGIWGFYNNLKEFMHRYGWGLRELPDDESLYLFRDKDGTKAEWSLSQLPLPYGSIQQLFSIMDMGGYIEAEDYPAISRFLRKAIAFDFHDKKQRDYLDSITFKTWTEQLGLPDRVADTVMNALAEMAYFDNINKVSALSLAGSFLLTRGSPKDLHVNFFANPPGETFLQPMVDYIEAHGGAIHYNTELTGMTVSDGRVSSVIASQLGDGQQVATRCAVCGALLGAHGRELNQCPECGANGDMIKTLAHEDLQERHFEADYFVSCMDVPASQRFYLNNLATLGNSHYFKNIGKLHATHVYIVNMWFEGSEFWDQAVTHNDGRPAFDFFATGFQDLGITLNWASHLQHNGESKALIKEYQDRNVSVIEVAIANAEPLSGLSDEQIVERLYQELRVLMPDIPEVKSSYVNRWRHYTAYHVGDMANRPAIQSPLDNLLFAGDMPFVDHPAVFMEKTNVTSKMATNLLLEKIGQERGKITILPSGTPNALVSLFTHFNSVYPSQS